MDTNNTDNTTSTPQNQQNFAQHIATNNDTTNVPTPAEITQWTSQILQVSMMQNARDTRLEDKWHKGFLFY